MLLITSGISGSGKSTLRKKLEDHFKGDMASVEPDDIRRKMWGSVNEQKDGHLVFKQAEKTAKKLLDEYPIVFFDATNTNWKRLKLLSSNITDNVLFIFMNDSFDEELCWNRVKSDIDAGTDRSDVPREVIQRQAAAFEQCFAVADPAYPGAFLYDPDSSDGGFESLIRTIEEKLNEVSL